MQNDCRKLAHYLQFSSSQYRFRDPNQPETIKLNAGETSKVRTGNGLTENGLVPQSTIDAIAGIDVQKQKLALVGAVGDQLGLDPGKYPSTEDYESDIADKLQLLQQSAEGQKQLDGIAANLGLDKLGVSIATLIGAIKAPGDVDDQRLANGFRSTSDIDTRYQDAFSEYAESHKGAGIYGPSGAFVD